MPSQAPEAEPARGGPTVENLQVAGGEGTTTPGARPWFTLDRLWLWLFLALVAVALPLLLFHYGAYHWFNRDEWFFLAGRGDSPFGDLLEPHLDAHWVAVPRLIFVAIWQVFGMTTYRPYQLVVVVTHLAVAVLLRVVMRRAGARPALATAAAAVFVLCGPGAVNTVWAFQVSVIGSMAWGLGQLLLADHDGPFDRRDVAALACGFLAISSSGIGVSTTVAVGGAVLLRRGWRPALAQTVPVAAVYLGWAAIADAETSGPFGRPSASVLLEWDRESLVGTVVAIGRFSALGWVLAAVLLTGVVLLAKTLVGPDGRAERVRLAMPIGLAVGALAFATTTGLGRAWIGLVAARSPRFVYVEAAFLLPLLAVSAEAVARRWRVLTPALVVMFLLPIPFNLGGFDPGIYGPAYMDEQRYILTTAVRMPFAHDVPRDVEPMQPRPVHDAQDVVTIGFLLTAAENGKLTPSTVPLTPEVVNEFKVRLGVAQRTVRGRPTGCREVTGPITIDPAKGDRLQLDAPVAIATQEGGEPTSRAVLFEPSGPFGIELTVELDDLHLQLRPPRGATTIGLCDGRVERPRPS